MAAISCLAGWIEALWPEEHPGHAKAMRALWGLCDAGLMDADAEVIPVPAVVASANLSAEQLEALRRTFEARRNERREVQSL